MEGGREGWVRAGIRHSSLVAVNAANDDDDDHDGDEGRATLGFSLANYDGCLCSTRMGGQRM